VRAIAAARYALGIVQQGRLLLGRSRTGARTNQGDAVDAGNDGKRYQDVFKKFHA
jgi:hypothetical protein